MYFSVQDDSKIGLSMKVVDQGNGQDLDPNGVQIQWVKLFLLGYVHLTVG